MGLATLLRLGMLNLDLGSKLVCDCLVDLCSILLPPPGAGRLATTPSSSFFALLASLPAEASEERVRRLGMQQIEEDLFSPKRNANLGQQT